MGRCLGVFCGQISGQADFPTSCGCCAGRLGRFARRFLFSLRGLPARQTIARFQMNFMRRLPHKTWIGVARDAVQQWRQRERWTLEAVTHQIVMHYYESGADGVWLVEFQQTEAGTDPMRARKTNAERIARWLDDQTKDTSLLPANLLPTVLGALPMDLRLACVTEMIGLLGFDVAIAKPGVPDATHATLVAAAAKEAGEAVAAFSLLADGMNQGALMQAKIELEEGRAALSDAINHVDGLLTERHEVGFGG